MLKWYEQIVPDGDVVISSRVRLARNLEDYKFSPLLTEPDAVKLVDDVKKITPTLATHDHRNFYSCNLKSLSEIDKVAMVERHIVSPLLDRKSVV